MLRRLVGFVLRRPRGILIAAVLLALIGGAASKSLFHRLSAGGFEDSSAQSASAAQVLQDRFGQTASNFTLLVTAPGNVDTPAVQSAGIALSRRLSAEPGVTEVTSYWSAGHPAQLRSRSGTDALILGTIGGDATTVSNRVSALIPVFQGTWDGLGVRVGGDATLQYQEIVQGQKDAETAEAIVFPATLVLLVLIFGSVVAAAMPLAVAVITTLMCLGCMRLLTTITTLASLAVSVVTLLGLGLAIDYSLLVISRYREELRSGQPMAEAVAATIRSAGRTVMLSALTVSVALAGLTWIPLPAVRSMGYAGIATALLAGATSVTVLPALLVVLGPRIDKWRILRRGIASDREGDVERGFWHRLATFAMRRPTPIAIGVTAVLVLLGVPALGLKLGMPDARVMPASSSARQVATTIGDEFDTSAQNSLQVVMERAPADRAALVAYASALSRSRYVAQVDTVTGSYEHGTQVAGAGPRSAQFSDGPGAFLSVLPSATGVAQPDQFTEDVRAVPPPAPVLVGGIAAVNRDATQGLLRWLPYALGSVLLVMLVLLFLVTGSVLVPFLSLLLSGLSLTATFGALVWVFQDGHLASLLGGFTVTGTIPATVPAMLFALSFGLAMDYQVFLLSRIREEYDRLGDGTAAVAQGLERIGRIVTAAAVLISVVFLAFVASGITLSKAYGIGLPLAVLLDASLVRGALLPASMRLAGRAAWWAPPALRRLHWKASLREEGMASAGDAPAHLSAS
jgi:RND superfamily putative drug exporter